MRRSVGRSRAPASIPKQPGRAARFTDVGATGQIGSRTDLPHCTSRHHVDVAGARDWPQLSEPERFLPDRRPPEPLFASAASPEFPLGPVLEAKFRGGRRRKQGLRRPAIRRSEEHTSELQSLAYLVCRLLLEKKKKQ